MAYADGSERETPAWKQGYQAYRRGESLRSNPYDYSDEHDAWEQGWQEALTDGNNNESET